MTEISFDADVVACRWSLSWWQVWHVIEMFVVVLSMGFALGYCYAKRQNERTSVLQNAQRQGASNDGPEKGRSIPLEESGSQTTLISTSMRCEYCTDDVNPNIFPYKYCSGCGAKPAYHHGRCCPVRKMFKEGVNTKRECSCRSIATQSQCTYKRKLLTPRFFPLPESSAGVSDVSFSHTD